MPHFSESGHDMVLCQVCGRDIDTGKEKVTWRPDITGSERAGNVCSKCLARETAAKPMDLVEHCRRESGLTGQALRDYINRHYGHN